MKPLRFLLMFILASVSSFLVSSFFIFTANLLGEVRLIFTGFVLSILITFLFSYLYFKGVPSLSWKERVEAIVVWLGLIVIVDVVTFNFVYNGSLSDLGMFTVTGYGLTILTLFVSAYITSSEHPRLARSPNLMAVPPPVENKKRLNKKQA